ncbi:hypothetical protein T459_14367 [Capsicum annuum]|uniref:PIPK domain-containing protein n=1 Tax=Capsicum annuum TaxID=4072 RepID=A0A2G2ZH82_CAPAN|nr:hypothetical protein T459_14367 [Capsicum annuum]
MAPSHAVNPVLSCSLSSGTTRLCRVASGAQIGFSLVDVMDYSLLVGVDEEREELVLGIIDFLRQYTWNKHLETWVKSFGILGGLKNASPTIISSEQ